MSKLRKREDSVHIYNFRELLQIQHFANFIESIIPSHIRIKRALIIISAYIGCDTPLYHTLYHNYVATYRSVYSYWA